MGRENPPADGIGGAGEQKICDRLGCRCESLAGESGGAQQGSGVGAETGGGKTGELRAEALQERVDSGADEASEARSFGTAELAGVGLADEIDSRDRYIFGGGHRFEAERQAAWEGGRGGRGFGDGGNLFQNRGLGKSKDAAGARSRSLLQGFEFGVESGPRGGEKAVFAARREAAGRDGGGAEQMQLLTGAGAGDVKETLALFVEAKAALLSDPLVEGAGVVAFGADGGDEELVLAGNEGIAALEGTEQGRIVLAGSAVEPGDDDNIEAEAFGFVDGHELETAALTDRWVGLSVEALEVRFEGRGERREAIGSDGVEQRKEDLDVFVRGRIDRGRTAERAPGAVDPGGEGGRFGLTPAEIEGAAEDLRGAGEALLTIRGEQVQVAIDKLKDRHGSEGAMVGASEDVEVGESEAAPGRAQNGEPGDAVHGMQEGAGEREQIAELLAGGEGIDFNGAEGDAAIAEQRDQLMEVRAIADEHGDAVFGAGCAGLFDAGEMSLDDVKDVASFLAAGLETFFAGRAAGSAADELRADVDGLAGGRACRRDGGRKVHGGGAGRRGFGANALEEAVERCGEAGVGAKIDGKPDGVAMDAIFVPAEAVVADVGEELNFGLAKHVDRLHGIADEEGGAMLARIGSRIPRGEKPVDELVLAAGSVLELVDEEMAGCSADAGEAVGDFVENGERGGGDLDEVDGVGFSKDDFELSDGAAQDREDVAEGEPLLVGVPFGRQIADGAEGREKLRPLLEAGEQIEHGGFALLALGVRRTHREAVPFVDGFAPLVFIREEQTTDAVPMLDRHCRRNRFQFGKQSNVLVAVGARVLCQANELLGERGLGREQSVRLVEGTRDFAAERRLKVASGLVPLVLGHCAAERQDLLPLVAGGEHLNQELLAVGEAIVTQVEQVPESCVELGGGTAEPLEGTARGESVERDSVLNGLKRTAETCEEGAVVRDTQAEGIDRFDGEPPGMVEQVPVAAFGLCEGCAGESDAVRLVGREGAAAGGCFEIGEDAGTHFGRRRASEGDGEDFFGLVDDGKELEEATGKQVGFTGTGGGLDDNGAIDVEGSFARVGVGGKEKRIRHRQPRPLCRLQD